MVAIVLPWLIVLGLALSGPAFAQPVATATPGALGCIIEPIQTADVAAPGSGVIKTLLVDRGQTVRKGQLLATMTSEVERASLASARARAQADAEIGAAGAAREAAKQKLRRIYELSQLGFAAHQELDQARSDYEIADYRLFQAREAQSVARKELRIAEEQLELRQVRSPIAGVVADRLVNPGERADGRPILRILTLDRLRVEVVLPSAYFGRVREGMNLMVTPETGDAKSLDAKVVQVDRFVDTASGTFRSRMLVTNLAGDIPAGVRCHVALQGVILPAPSAAGAAATATAPVRRGLATAPKPAN